MSGASENFPEVSMASSVELGKKALPAVQATRPPNREKFIMQAVADFESPLIGYAMSILHDLDLARDVVQDTFIRLCQQDLITVEDRLKPWLFTVCRNRSLDLVRKDRRLQSLEDSPWQKVADSGLLPDEQANLQEQQTELMIYLDRLTANQREAILLKFQHDLSYLEIQKITGLTSSNIGFLIHTGLRRLREILPEDLRL
jgi:RNA polymerase sigma-70 factor (ECF subfamily)